MAIPPSQILKVKCQHTNSIESNQSAFGQNALHRDSRKHGSLFRSRLGRLILALDPAAAHRPIQPDRS